MLGRYIALQTLRIHITINYKTQNEIAEPSRYDVEKRT